MLRTVLFFVFALSFALLSASVFTATLRFAEPLLSTKDGYTVLTVDNTVLCGEQGEPQLPYRKVVFALPQGEELDEINVSGKSSEIALASPLFPTQEQYPLSYRGQIAFTQPNSEIYTQNAFPTQNYRAQKTGYLRGVPLASLSVTPVVYRPRLNKITYYTELTITVSTKTEQARNLRNVSVTAETLSQLENMVDNPQFLANYQDRFIAPESAYDYLIITAHDFAESFQLLADYKNSLGLKTKIAEVENILAETSGNDAQEKIRNYIIDQYEQCGISYLLLGGDTEIIPARGFTIAFPGNEAQSDYDIASDLYYTNLDGTWNANNNNYWGEWNEVDWYAEVYGGRAPVSSIAEADNFVYKQLAYQTHPISTELTKNLFVGEDLGWTCWGDDYMEEIRNGSTNFGYTTAGVPSNFTVNTLYDTPSFTWTPANLYSQLNAGYNLVGHLGHANVNYVLKFYNDDVTPQNFTNNGVTHTNYILYTQGCYCNSFDNRNTEGYATGYDAVSEKMLNLATGASVFIGNTRYGWGDGNSTNGASQHLMREFYDALYGEQLSIIGKTQADSKDDIVPFITPNSVLGWVFYECTLMGDPSLDIWTASPMQATLTLPDSLAVGATRLQANIIANGTGQRNARLAVFAGDNFLGSGVSDVFGSVNINFLHPILAAGELSVRVSGHNLQTATRGITAYTSQNAMVYIDSLRVAQDDNGILDWGETAELEFTAKNLGQTASGDILLVISCNSPYLTVLDNEVNLGSLAPNAIAASSENFLVRVSENIPENTSAEIIMLVMSDTDTWNYTFNVNLYKPELAFNFSGFSNLGQGAISPGSSIKANLTVASTYPANLQNVNISLTCDHPQVVLQNNMINMSTWEAGEELDLSHVGITLENDLSSEATLNFYLNVDCGRNYTLSKIYTLQLANYYEDFEEENCLWTHAAVNSATADQWNLVPASDAFGNGAQAYLCGNAQSGNYNAHLLAGLESPQLLIPPNGKLFFYHTMDAEADGNSTSTAYDGGFVQISVDGGEYAQITPIGGYPYLSLGNSGSSIAADTPLWSGYFAWTEAVFNLAAYAGHTVKFRFVFSSDSYVSGNGWMIDNIKITVDKPLLSPPGLVANYRENYVNLSWMTPDCTVDSYIIKRNEQVIAENVCLNSYRDNVATFPTTAILRYSVASVQNGIISEFSSPCEVQLTSADGNINAYEDKLKGNYPNPFNPSTTIGFSIGKHEANPHVELIVYDIKGRKVISLFKGILPAGKEYSYVWAGKNEQGKTVASGVYFSKLRIGKHSYTRKMLLLK